MHKLAITFGKEIPPDYDFENMGEKAPTYREFVKKCEKAGFETQVISTQKYIGNGVFKINGEDVKFDIAYDRSGGVKFPRPDDNFRVVDSREFKILAWDKWLSYKHLSGYMPKTFLLEKKSQLPEILEKISGDNVVIKPTNGLKGAGIYIGKKEGSCEFEPDFERKYIVQEFIDTKKGIPGVMSGIHDLRIVIINGKIVWSHFRTPPVGDLKSNVAGGGKLEEVDLERLPKKVIEISNEIAKLFYDEFDNPLFSVDFGIDKNEKPWVFEINDQIGFPKPDANGKEKFISELVENLVLKV